MPVLTKYFSSVSIRPVSLNKVLYFLSKPRSFILALCNCDLLVPTAMRIMG